MRGFLTILAIPALIALLILGFNTFRGLVEPDANHLTIVGYEGQGLSGAIISTPNGQQTTSVEGGNAFVVFDLPALIEVSAEGYRTAVYDV